MVILTFTIFVTRFVHRYNSKTIYGDKYVLQFDFLREKQTVNLIL